MEIKKIGVVGCGLMGSRLVQTCAKYGYEVIVSELNDEVLNRGLEEIRQRLSQDLTQGRLTSSARESVLANINGTTDIRDFADCDLAIETVTENVDLKKRVFRELDKACPEHAVLATNTSAASIIDIAMETARPQKVLGIHGDALNVPVTEIVKTIVTSEETLDIGKKFVESLGKTFIIVPDVPGFLVNRLWNPFMLNAIRAVEAGIATAEDIDHFFTKGFGLPIGPLTAADYGGLDTLLYTANNIYTDLRESQYMPPVLLKKMVAAGQLGVKTGKGFYEYE
ncbi:3-hydroxyacyl-CoA dehydrogenase family protein [Chloroflexota bacterium]